MRKTEFKINDYVLYTGDGTANEPARKNKDYAKILDLIIIENIEYVCLQLLSIDKKISCPKHHIRVIETSQQHLINLGFEEVNSISKRVCYIKNNIYISKLGLSIPGSDIYFFISGFCLADFRSITNVELNKYLTNNKVDAIKFFKDFPKMNNINDIFDIDKVEETDREKIINSISLL